MRFDSMKRRRLCLMLASCLSAGSVFPAEELSIQALKELSLDDLVSLKITSVSRRPESAASAAAAVSVLTGEEIRRAGVRNIPDALRLVPGVHVASVNSHTWGVSTRGFNAVFSNKQLVLIDGRSVYSPAQSGVY